jgi:hypothetical protein
MKKCDSCGSMNANNSRYCKNCGESDFSGSYNRGDSGSSMHWIYFLLIGWWLGLIVASSVLPFYSKGGRKLIAATFGYW